MKKNKEMKPLLIIFLMINIYGKVYAQGINDTVPIMQCRSYIPNSNLGKIVGTWKWSSGTDSFTMMLRKEKVYDTFSNDFACVDKVYGVHEYIKNGQLVETALEYANVPLHFLLEKRSLYFSGIVSDPKIFRGMIVNLSNKNRALKITLEVLDNHHIKINKIETYPGLKVYLKKEDIPSSEIDLPQAGIIMKKQ